MSRNLADDLEKSQDLVATLNTNCFHYREKIEKLQTRLADCEVKAAHFNILLKAINENELVKKEWERFMMTLRMTGYDSTGK